MRERRKKRDEKRKAKEAKCVQEFVRGYKNGGARPGLSPPVADRRHTCWLDLLVGHRALSICSLLYPLLLFFISPSLSRGEVDPRLPLADDPWSFL